MRRAAAHRDRARHADPGFLFLDEASSALDEATEAGIMQHIRSLAGDVTILAVTHRKSVIAPGDRVLRRGAGRIESDGPVSEARTPED